MSSVSTGEEIWETLGYIRLHGKFTSAQFYSARSRMSLDICAFPQFSLKLIKMQIIISGNSE